MGPVSFDEMAELISRAVLRCRREKINKLLIDSRGVPEFRPPRPVLLYSLAERIAADAKSRVKIAHVGSPEWVRSGKFGVVVAKNRGLDANNFDSEPEALKWLLTPEGK